MGHIFIGGGGWRNVSEAPGDPPPEAADGPDAAGAGSPDPAEELAGAGGMDAAGMDAGGGMDGGMGGGGMDAGMGGGMDGGMGGGGMGGGFGGAPMGPPPIEDKDKKRKLFEEYENLAGTMDELQASMNSLVADETLTPRERSLLSELGDHLSDAKDSLDVVVTQKFLAADYSSLLMLFINFRTSTLLISRVLGKAIGDGKKKVTPS
jgi:hypothetical protein